MKKSAVKKDATRKTNQVTKDLEDQRETRNQELNDLLS